MRFKTLPRIVASILLLALPHPAFSWGNEGHQIVAQIAARKLTLAAQQRIVALLRSDPNDDLHLKAILGTSGPPPAGALETALKTMAIWPDHMPGGKGPTSPWHFIDIGLFEDPSHIDQRCPGGACVTQKITDLVQNLRSGQSLTINPPSGPPIVFTPPKELRFLVHFLGDIHQPLHCVSNADAGGNCIKEKGYDLEYPELHAVWDTGLVQEFISTGPPDTAGAIIQEFDGKLTVPGVAPKAIAAESFEIAKHVYQAGIPAIPIIDHFVDVNPLHCDTQAPAEINALMLDARASYDKPAVLQVVREQLYKGGVRLAAILNALSSPPHGDLNPVGNTESVQAAAPRCDDSLWQHVYNPQRLTVKQKCIAVTGTIVDATAGRQRDGVRHEADGDTHGWLRVDPQFKNLLNAGNVSDEGGNLVFEIVCKFRVTQADAKAACPANFHTTVKIPPVGSHVQILGTYVQDTNHAQWMEIHPVTSITVLPH